MIQVKNITKIYGKKKKQMFTALDDVSFHIPEGASVAIVGKSGSGKSTLMHSMSGLDKPTSGEVIIDGKDIASMKQKQVDVFRATEMGFIFQAFFIQPYESCYNNVALPLEIQRISGKDRKKRIEEALELVDLKEKIHTRAVNLSGGQKQRLAIARAIAARPKILFADEPTGNLDSVTSALIEKLLFAFNRKLKTTLIIVTHDDELAEKCDIQIRMKDGKIEEMIEKKAKKSSAQQPTSVASAGKGKK